MLFILFVQGRLESGIFSKKKAHNMVQIKATLDWRHLMLNLCSFSFGRGKGQPE